MVDIIRAQLKAGAVTVGATATVIPATAITGRISILVHNNGSNTVYLGHSAVTTANGIPLAASSSMAFDLGEHALLYGIVAEGTEEVRILEGV